MTRERLLSVFMDRRAHLHRLLQARLRDAGEAEEALQDLWLRLSRASIMEVREPTAYLFRMANNMATDRLVARARRGALEASWLDMQPGADEYPDAERTILAQDWLAQVCATIDEMPERMRLAYMLFRGEGVSQRDIAARMAISLSAVEKLLQRAYARIHKLEHHGDE